MSVLKTKDGLKIKSLTQSFGVLRTSEGKPWIMWLGNAFGKTSSETIRLPHSPLNKHISPSAVIPVRDSGDLVTASMAKTEVSERWDCTRPSRLSHVHRDACYVSKRKRSIEFCLPFLFSRFRHHRLISRCNQYGSHPLKPLVARQSTFIVPSFKLYLQQLGSVTKELKHLQK